MPPQQFFERVTAVLMATLFVISALGVCGCRWNSEAMARRAARVSSLGRTQVSAKPVRRLTPLSPLGQMVTRKPEPSERTQLLLRRYVLDQRYLSDPQGVLKVLQKQARGNPNLTEVHAMAELAQIEGDWLSRLGKSEQAMKMYAAATLHSYQFLFDDQLDLFRNAYDPQFRSISDIYNHSLEQMIKGLIAQDKFLIGNRIEIEAIDEILSLQIGVQGRWRNQSFERFEIVNDYEVEGLKNEYRTYGLGVPVIAVREQQETHNPNEKYYPPKLSFPLTAFLQIRNREIAMTGRADLNTTEVDLKLIDPLQQTMVEVDGRRAPLESDISTPIAYYLNEPVLNSNVFATLAMLDADFAQDFQGLYMLEPYDPNKIPVVMIHGFWSSPVTWLAMFNDLRAGKDIRDHYQFWFFLYPTGQPFWVSAAQVRADLKRVRDELDPYRNSTALDQMVLVGHSMGGLVSRLQTIDGGEDFWGLVTDKPFEDVKGEPETLKKLEDIFFFEANKSIKRVITIGTPHQGSFFATNTARWLSHRAFSMPHLAANEFEKIIKQNPDVFAGTQFSKIRTSVDSLAPGAPFIESLEKSKLPEDVVFHNIHGKVIQNSLVNRRVDKGDGVVSVESATAIDSVSDLEVNSEHVDLHTDPKSILEVRRILLDHLVEIGWLNPEQRHILPVGHQQQPQETNAVRTAEQVEPSGQTQFK